jgi:peptidoglycan/xylan/chitin deacetylase (PgdA/CDA1 family)
VRLTGCRGDRWRRLTAVATAAGLIVLLAGAGCGFVLKSFPYRTPQDPPPGVTLSPRLVADFAPSPRGLAEVPVLTWRDVSRRPGLLVTAPGAFATQLAVLRRQGYRSIGLGALEAVASGRPVALPGRPVVLAFDDGLSTDWTTVDPILRRYGFRGIVFVDPADVAGRSPSYFLTRDELNAMASSGRWDIGLALPGGWRSGREAAAAAARAREQLQSDTGYRVTAVGWDAPTYPAATYAMLRRQFAAVFARPAGGRAGLVVNGSAAAPLPRLKVTARDSLRSLSLRLRAGIQAPPPGDPLSLPWTSPGGRCAVAADTLTVTGGPFTLCTVLANGARWTDYGLRLDIAAASGTTAIVELRVGDGGRLEIAFGRSGLSVKERIGRRWRLLRAIRVTSPVLTGAGVLPVSLHLTGRMLSVQVRGHRIKQQVSPQVPDGVIALGLAGPGKRAMVAFRHVAVVRSS